jgi:hypothetical protein
LDYPTRHNMKVHKVEVMIIDHDEVGNMGVIDVLENAHYSNRCISPKVISVQTKDIGEWTDEHPLNQRSTALDYYKKLFSTTPEPAVETEEESGTYGGPYQRHPKYPPGRDSKD